MTRAAPFWAGCAPVFDQEVLVLKALILGLCVFAVVALTAAAANGSATASGRSKSAHGSKAVPTRTAEEWLRVKLRAAHKYRTAIRFFETHRRLADSKHRVTALASLRHAHRALVKVTREAAYYRRFVQIRAEQRLTRRLTKAPPRTAICRVFGPYCQQAIDVAWCESRLSTTAQNGQYLGLFQMGSNERRLFGHGDTALDQAAAAHRYFMNSGRDWSPWSCRYAVY